jgi:hypothetical protein
MGIQSTAKPYVIACRGYISDVIFVDVVDSTIQRRCFMSSPRRHFLKGLLAAGRLQGLIASPGVGRATGALLDQDNAKNINPDFDAKAYSFWSDFLSSDAEPIVGASGQR